MATDIALILKNLASFFDFTGKKMIAVGAGGGQMAEYGRMAKEVIAVDSDADALKRLHSVLDQSNLSNKFTLIHEDFFRLNVTADVLLFEFCLHEMPDPGNALIKAGMLAPQVVIMDHLPGSPWNRYTGEEEIVKRSWKAIDSLPVKGRREYTAIQAFKKYIDLEDKLRPLGKPVLDRIAEFQGHRDIAIPMMYGMAILEF